MRAEVDTIQTPKAMLTLWLHEMCRVFQDRLVNNKDKEWFLARLNEKLHLHCQLEYSDVVNTHHLIFADFIVPMDRRYVQVSDPLVMVRVVSELLEDYNTSVDTPMKLVMFLEAIEHVARICRVIRLPLGNALLLGTGGSGRQSLTRLSAHIEEHELVSIQDSKG